MQVYPYAGDYAPHHYPAVVGDDYFCMDDYRYNNAFPRPSVQMMPDEGRLLPKQNTMRYYNGGSSMQTSPDQWNPLQRPNYSYLADYGVHDQNSDNFKHGFGDYSPPQYPQLWSGKEQHNNGWNNRTGYLVHGNYSGSMSPDVKMSGAYGIRTPINKHRPYYSEQYKAPPVWVPKGIVD